MALCPVELLAPPCLQITPSNHAGIEPGGGAALVRSRKTLHPTFPAHNPARGGRGWELGGCVSTGGRQPGLHAEVGFCSSFPLRRSHISAGSLGSLTSSRPQRIKRSGKFYVWPQRRELGHTGIMEDAGAQGAVSLVVCHDHLVSCTLLGWLEATFQLTWVLEHGLLPGEDSMGTPLAVSSTGWRLRVKKRIYKKAQHSCSG